MITRFEPMENNTPTPAREIKAPITPISSNLRLPYRSIFNMATKVKIELTKPTRTAPKKELSTLSIDSFKILGAKYMMAAIPLKWANIGSRIPIKKGLRK